MLRSHPVTRWGALFLSLWLGSAAAPAFGKAAAKIKSAPAQAEPSAAPEPAVAPMQGTIAETLKAAYDAFNQGDYLNAASALETVVGNAQDSAALEPVYFMLGAADFNAADYPKAIGVFKTFEKKFPKSPRYPNVAFSLGQAYLLTKQYPEAAAVFKELDKVSPEFRLEARLFAAEALQEQGNADEAIGMIEPLVANGVNSPVAAKAALMLAPLYAEKEDSQKAVALVTDLGKNVKYVDNPVEFNSVAIKMGDKFLDGKLYEEALACYRQVHFKEEVIKLQAARIEARQQDLARNVAAVRADPTIFVKMVPINSQIMEDIAAAKKILEGFMKLPGYVPTLDLRIGRALYELDKKWESIVAYGDVLRKFPAAPEAEPSLFGTVVAFVDLQRAKDAQTYGDQYLKDFPTGPNASTVGFLMGAVALNLQDYAGAEAIFTRIIREQPKSSYREEMLYMLGNCKFAQSDFPGAAATFKQYLSEFPQGKDLEDVEYRAAVCPLFEGNPDAALGPAAGVPAKIPERLVHAGRALPGGRLPIRPGEIR